MAPIDHTLADTQIGSGFGITTLPHIRDFAITGPFKVTGVSDTPSRRTVFSCRPTAPPKRPGAPPRSSSGWRRRPTAGRRAPPTCAALMGFYEQGRNGGDFEAGIRLALEALLASPRFVFRLEQPPATARAARPTPSPTSSWPRGCRSSSGARCPTRNWCGPPPPAR